MARSKKAGRGSRQAQHESSPSRNLGWTKHGVRPSAAFVPAGPPPLNHRGATFSLRDAAANSGHGNLTFDGSSLTLRHQAVQFVRGDNLVGDLAEYVEGVPNEVDSTPTPHPAKPRSGNPGLEASSNSVVINATFASPSPKLGLQQRETPQRGIDSSSSDSEDEVLFAGRNQSLQSSSLSNSRDVSILINELHRPSVMGNAELGTPEECGVLGERTMGPQQSLLTSLAISCADDPITHPAVQTSRQRREEALDDYIANITSDVALAVDTDSQTKETNLLQATHLNGWDSDDLEDFKELSTSEDDDFDVDQILQKRYRKGKDGRSHGPDIQYLLFAKGTTADDAKWIPRSRLTSIHAQSKIEMFEEKARLANLKALEASLELDEDDKEEDLETDTGWATEDDDVDNSGIEEEEEEEDYVIEDEIIAQRIARMSDEQYARILQKQEELGMSGDDLQIFDGLDGADDLEDLIEPSRNNVLKTRHRKRKGKISAQSIDSALGVELGGDDYGTFDVMDFERPSLKNGHGRHSDPFELKLSDSELERSLHDSWAADRRKKGIRKKEREELRAQGLLGRKANAKPDLKARYTAGMSVEQMEDELEEFLFADDQELHLPPMKQDERKAIHQIANVFKLKSKSQGKGDQRFTILYKTSRTVDFSPMAFDKLRTKLRRKFLPRGDQKGKFSSSSRRGGASGNGFSYRDGEVVGAAAPEIGQENRGRAMLSKMGWKDGTALGSTSNQGILKPIEHVVKVSKAGLG